MTSAERVWTFDVELSTHDLLKRGVTARWVRRVTVLVEPGEGQLEASLVAYSMAADHDKVITAVWPIY